MRVERQVSRSGENLAALRMSSSPRRRQPQKADEAAAHDAAPRGVSRSSAARRARRCARVIGPRGCKVSFTYFIYSLATSHMYSHDLMKINLSTS